MLASFGMLFGALQAKAAEPRLLQGSLQGQRLHLQEARDCCSFAKGHHHAKGG